MNDFQITFCSLILDDSCGYDMQITTDVQWWWSRLGIRYLSRMSPEGEKLRVIQFARRLATNERMESKLDSKEAAGN